MKKQIDHLKEFHNSFDLLTSEKPTLVDKKTYTLRHKLMEEENNEYLAACKNNDLVEVADALGDQLYILLGTILAHGMQDIIEDVFDEIQRSNMSKLGEDGKPIRREDGKILKGPNFSPPNISKFLT